MNATYNKSIIFGPGGPTIFLDRPGSTISLRRLAWPDENHSSGQADPIRAMAGRVGPSVWAVESSGTIPIPISFPNPSKTSTGRDRGEIPPSFTAKNQDPVGIGILHPEEVF